MVDLSCKYLGLQLKNPVVVGSSGLSSSIRNLDEKTQIQQYFRVQRVIKQEKCS